MIEYDLHNCITYRDEQYYYIFNPYTIGSIRIPNVGSVTESIKNFGVPTLYENGILIDGNLNGNSIAKFLLNKAKYDKKRLYLTDAITYKCNLNCVYCMQQNTFKGINRITPVEKVAIWERLFKMSNCELLNVCLFGGEPFYDYNYLFTLLNQAKSKNLNIQYSAVTNGTLINDDTISLINNYSINHIQITIDGPAYVHDKRRIGNKAKNTFEQIINNILKLLENTECEIVLNTVLDRNNKDTYIELVKFLNSKFSKFCFSSQARIIFNLGMECHPYNKSDYTNESIIKDLIEYHKIYLKYLQELLSLGNTIRFVMPNGLCIAKHRYEYLIAPDGCIYKCITGLGLKEFRLGYLNDIYKDALPLLLKESQFIEKEYAQCNNCKYQALCNGGCYYSAFINQASIDCRKQLFDAVLEEYVKLSCSVVKTKKGYYKGV